MRPGCARPRARSSTRCARRSARATLSPAGLRARAARARAPARASAALAGACSSGRPRRARAARRRHGRCSTSSAASASTRFGHADRGPARDRRGGRRRATRVFQGHLCPGAGVPAALARRCCGTPARGCAHVWLSVSGAMANENALKMIFQKHAPGRPHRRRSSAASRAAPLAMAELTDKPAYREGLPLRGSALLRAVLRPEEPDATRRASSALDAHLARYPGRVAGDALRAGAGRGRLPHRAAASSSRALMQRCREAGIAVWVDEVQTFARTGELFAFRTLRARGVRRRRHGGQGAPGQRRALQPRLQPAAGAGGGHLRRRDRRHGGRRAHHRAARERGLSRPRRAHRGARRRASSAASRRCARRLPRAVGPRSRRRRDAGLRAVRRLAEVVAGGRCAPRSRRGCWSGAPAPDPTKIRMLLPGERHRRGARGRLRDAREGAARASAEERGLPC